MAEEKTEQLSMQETVVLISKLMDKNTTTEELFKLMSLAIKNLEQNE